MIVLALLGGGVLLYLKAQVDQTVANVASLLPTSTPGLTPFSGGAVEQPTVAPVAPPTGSGVITFGTSFDDKTLLIDKPVTTFKRTSSKICWSAEWSKEATHATVRFFLIKAFTGGSESELFHETDQVSNPAFTVWANCTDFRPWTDSKAGTYRLRYLDGTTILAAGTFKLK